MANRLTATTASWVPFPLRLALGTIMFVHGAQKIFGAWGGMGLSRWIAGVAPLGLEPSWAWLAAAAFSEFIGGALVLLGFYTRLGAFFIACTMAVAVFGFHWPRGFFMSNGGFEYPFALLGMAIALIVSGGGNASLDAQMGVRG